MITRENDHMNDTEALQKVSCSHRHVHLPRVRDSGSHSLFSLEDGVGVVGRMENSKLLIMTWSF